MRAFNEYRNESKQFWATVQFISEHLGYSERGGKCVRSYTIEEIQQILAKKNLNIDIDLINKVKSYLDQRAYILNEFVQNCLMNAIEAKKEYEKLKKIYDSENLKSKIPLNKQKGEMRQVAYFTAMINILTEREINKVKESYEDVKFDDDPSELVYVIDQGKNILGATSRRYDGAFPSIYNPISVWEIKEYYYATTFGSRVADGVYETQLDGYEFQNIQMTTGRHIEHIFFIDAYQTWWEKGKSYLCRIIDALNMGLVDEVIVGKEVLSRWPILMADMVNYYCKSYAK